MLQVFSHSQILTSLLRAFGKINLSFPFIIWKELTRKRYKKQKATGSFEKFREKHFGKKGVLNGNGYISLSSQERFQKP